LALVKIAKNKNSNQKLENRKKILHFFSNEFMKNQTLRVPIGSTLSEEKQIENEVIHGVVLSVMLVLVAMAELKNPSR
jgi:hypothetical protein